MKNRIIHNAADNRKSGARAARASREMLLELTVSEVALGGLEQVSLRQIAKSAGVSTTAIFQNFASKADLIAAAADYAVRCDVTFHDQLREDAFGLVAGKLGFADFIATYIELRAQRSEASFLSELLVHPQEQPQCHDALRRWHHNRLTFWLDLVDLQTMPAGLGAIVCSYVLMEELYAFALPTHPQYRLLMLETCRALCDAAFSGGHPNASLDSAAARLGTEPFAVRLPPAGGSGQPIAEQILRSAVAIINEAGVHALNQRNLASRAGVSASLIAYHYKDMKALTTQAVWHALVQGIPTQLDPEVDSPPFPTNLRVWFATLESMLRIDNWQSQGFYIRLSRLSAEACLLARRNPELVPLITYLRGLEGWGTYRVSQSIALLAGSIGRDQAAAFAIWIKSNALLRIAGLAATDSAGTSVEEAAGVILPSPDR